MPAGREAGEKIEQPQKTALPMQYLYVFRNLDGKYKNIYDAGFNHSNHIYVDSFSNLWFIGLRKPEEVRLHSCVYNHRTAPYPFQEANYSILGEIPAMRMEAFLKFMQDYNLRAFQFDNDFNRFFMLANFSGPMNLWSGDLSRIVDGLNQREE
jgi:hypothetical protein